MFRFALQNLRSRPLRTALSMLGLTVAIAGMVGLFSIAGGIAMLVQSTFEQIPGLLVQQRGAPLPLFSALPADWQAEIAAVPGVTVVNAEVLSRVNRIQDQTIISPPRFLLGFDIVERLKLKHGVYDENLLPGGRFLDQRDVGTRNCLVSRQIASEFDLEVGDPIEVNGFELTVVGIYHCGSLLLDVNILLDINAVREMARVDPATVSCFYAEQDGSVTDSVLAEQIEARFAGRDLRLWQPSPLQKVLLDAALRGGATGTDTSAPDAPVPDEPDVVADANQPNAPSGGTSRSRESESPIEVRTQEDWAERFEDFTGDLKLFLTVMTAVGLLIAVFSIINTMLMSVTERMIEFGILRANGWTRRNVIWLITFESGLLGLGGGLLGAMVGWVVVQGINAWQPERLNLYAGPALLATSVLFSTVLGMLGGLYPAWRAATKPPMEAIRRV
ncbi:MAG: ABC transporter permease [Planctomycetaceae bacterium]